MNTIRQIFKTHGLLIYAGLMSALAYSYLAFNSQYYAQAGLFELWLVCGFCALLSFIVWARYYHQKIEIPVGLILFFAILFRIIGISGFPVLEDDFYRYLWDGRMTIETGSPYAIIPAHFFVNELGQQFEQILGLINYPDIATVYGPVCQWVFALAYLFAPGEVWPLQAMFALADVGIILLLFRLAKPAFVLLYAWSPLLITEFAFSAHPDVLGAFFLTAAFYAYTRQYWYRLAVLLALAAGVKVFALILTPILLRFHWRGWLLFVITAVLIALPFGVSNAWFPTGLSAMADAWLFNAPLYFLLSLWYPIGFIKTCLLALFATISVCYFFYLVKTEQLLPVRADYLFGLLFLCSPVVNAWYLVWLLPFAAIYPSFWAWVASVSILLSYASGINIHNSQLDLYQQPVWSLTAQFALILMALLWDLTNKDKRHRIKAYFVAKFNL